jgi:TPR repeat protein
MELGDIFREKGDRAKAVAYYERASERGHRDAPYWLGVLCEGVGASVEASVEAAGWYEVAAERGSVLAQRRLAEMHRAGTGVERDDVVAAFWQCASESTLALPAAAAWPSVASWPSVPSWPSRPSVPHAGADAGRLSWFARRAEFLWRAANQGHAQAQYRVARMLLSGDFFEKDEAASARWMRKAADAGHAQAALCVARGFPAHRPTSSARTAS